MDYKFLAYGCPHEPITHKDYREWLFKNIEDYQPDYIVNLGDWFEGLGGKKWDKHPSETWLILNEFDAVRKHAQRLNEICPNAKKVFIFGNHDSNLLHEPHRMDDETRAFVSREWFNMLETDLKGWIIPCKQYAHNEFFRLGQITFQHGCNTGRGQANTHLAKQAIAYGVPYGLHVSAHTHAPAPVTQIRFLDIHTPYWFANVGTGADWEKMHYMNRASKDLWGRGLLRGTVSRRSVDQRKAFYSSPQWQAELLVHSYASANRFIA